MSKKTVLISGASIAGPTLAYWLHRYGWETTIIERAPELRTGGQNIDIRGAGQTIACRMGIEHTIRDATTGEVGTRFVDAHGHTVAASRVSDGGGGATAELEILRGDLARILVDATTPGTKYNFGDTITALHHNQNDVTVSFANGEDRTFDLVVLAEGKNSRSRDLAFNDVTIRPLGLYTAFLTIPRLDADTQWARWYNATGGRAIILRPDNKGTTRAALSFISDRAGYDDRDPDAQKRVLKTVFKDAGWEAPRVLDALDSESDMYFEYLGQVQMPQWSTGRIAVVGDAAACASPISGMGTSLALVGAYVLAGELAAHVDHRDAFRGYERIMRPYVEQAQNLPPGTPRLANPKSAPGIALLRLALKIGTSRAFDIIGDRFFSPPAEKIELPDYQHLEQH
ncbi:FAD-dependent monooxygenase [Arthrobacter sp. RCC_34]|uniref:FAD-dependent monooxygenase n=1 Tax=Arthrobacter sp. RCC_34 TaxID=3239230 RepID=UPI003525EEC8